MSKLMPNIFHLQVMTDQKKACSQRLDSPICIINEVKWRVWWCGSCQGGFYGQGLKEGRKAPSVQKLNFILYLQNNFLHFIDRFDQDYEFWQHFAHKKSVSTHPDLQLSCKVYKADHHLETSWMNFSEIQGLLLFSQEWFFLFLVSRGQGQFMVRSLC